MAHLTVRSRLSRGPLQGQTATPAGVVAGPLAPHARADAVAYLVNVTVRSGCNVADADAALAYGYRICDKVEQGGPDAQILADVWADSNTYDEWQASYLITQAVSQSCPALIWQLCNLAAQYRPTGT